MVHKLSVRPTCTEDGQHENSRHITFRELNSPGEGKAEGTGVGIAGSGGQGRKVGKIRIVTEQGCFSVFPEAGEEGLAYTGDLGDGGGGRGGGAQKGQRI